MALWRDVVGYEGMYRVSNEGQIKSLVRKKFNGHGCYTKRERILRPGKRGKGGTWYEFVVLADGNSYKHYSVHRLVAEAFLPNPQKLPEVNHKDENTMNNSVNNLEWCTREYNINYSKAKRVAQLTPDGEKLAEYQSITAASRISGISRTAINNCLTGWSGTAGGYLWKYETEE